MGHPLIDEFGRVRGVQNCRPEFFNRCQRVFRDEVQPLLDERDRLFAENAELKAQIAKLSAKRERVPA